ncbi:hypothetical protein J4Q44_G00222730 [Coregonus suidteri]|uniref:ZP domain-containing protein n=1 Tax=Coregonus suidteri TaxID=861788 RepID=A0AAN8LC04_9TELE
MFGLACLRYRKMGVVAIVLLCFTIGLCIPVEDRAVKFSDGAMTSVWQVPDFTFSVEGGNDIPYDTIFSSWLTGVPNFNMLAELPPHINLPRIQVICSGTQLNLQVDKRFNGVVLSGDELMFGEGCQSNGAHGNEFVFIYELTQCGTNRETHNGFETYSNFLHFNPRNSLFTSWLTPFLLPISCMQQRSEASPPAATPVPPMPVLTPVHKSWGFTVNAMNPSWTNAAEINIYERGQIIYLQVSVSTRPAPNQQLFIRSCFASMFPDPATRTRLGVILNKGCVASVASQHAVAEFVALRRADAVNFILNTSLLPLQTYVHCSVIISNQGVSPDAKSCNYNRIKSRWEEISGDVEVCRCCGSRCKGSSFKTPLIDAKAIVSIGPLMVVGGEPKANLLPSAHQQEFSSSSQMSNYTQADSSDSGMYRYKSSLLPQFVSAAPSGLNILMAAGASVSDRSLETNMLPEPPRLSPSVVAEGLMVLSQDKGDSLTVWLPGQVQVHSDVGLRAPLSSYMHRDAPWVPSPSVQNDDLGKTPVPKVYSEAAKQNSLLNSAMDGIWSQQTETVIKATDSQSVVRTKLQLTQAADGSQTLSYEEARRPRGEEPGIRRRFGVEESIPEKRLGTGQTNLVSSLLDLLRRLDKAE